VDSVEAAPLEDNILEWRYVIRGPKDSPYAGGIYHGKLVFPPQYPYKPPAIMMITPNGRFKTDTRLCLSISDFHPESWNPLWNVGSILTGVLSFMLETAPTYGSMETSDYVKRDLARKSLAFNVRDTTFAKLFPHYVTMHEQRIRAESEQKAANGSTGSDHSPSLSSGPGAKRAQIWDGLIVCILVVFLAVMISYLL